MTGSRAATTNRTARLLVWLVVPAVFIVYVITISPTVGLIDSGEISAGTYLMNILHPTGYPVYAMLGRLAGTLPLGAVTNRVALLSALLAAAGVGMFLWLALRLKLSRTAAGVSAMLLGLSIPVWGVAVDVEVYSLTLVLLALLWLAAARAEASGDGLLPLAYVCGLCLTNHMSALWAVIGAGVCVVLVYRTAIIRPLPVLGLAFVAALSPYLVLMVRAKAGPYFPWGDPVSLERLWWHITGRQYQVWMFSLPFGEVLKNAGRGFVIVGRGLLWVLVPAAAYGFVRFVRQRRALAAGLLVSAVLTFGYAVNYAIPDIEAYYIPCLLALLVFAAVGVDRLSARMGRWRYVLWVLVPAALLLNFRTVSRQGHYVAYDHAMNTLQSAAPNATVITDWWDLYSVVLYLGQVEHARNDVCMVDKELLRRSWYLKYLKRAYPWLAERSTPEIEQYMRYLNQFEHGRLRDDAAIQRCFIALLESFVARNPERPAYTTFDADAGIDAQQLLPRARRVPVGLLFELSTDTVLPRFDYTKLRIRVPRYGIDERTGICMQRYRFFVLRRANELALRGRPAERDTLVNWYVAQPVARLFPLPPRR
jgi:hypothetical protein